MSITRPLHAAKQKKLPAELTKEEFDQAHVDFIHSFEYPLQASIKRDGMRCLKVDGQVLSRSFKPIANEHTTRVLKRLVPNGMDGELMLRGDTDFNDVQSAFTTIKGAPQFDYWIFDYVKDSLSKPYTERINDLEEWLRTDYQKNRMMPLDAMHDVRLVLPILMETPEQLIVFEQECIDNGHEGVIVRTPDGPYKCGRATLNEGLLTKVVRKFRDEGIVIGFQEQMSNENEKVQDEFGLSKRSSKKGGKVKAGVLGNFNLRLESGKEVEVGTGYKAPQRKEMWTNREAYLGKIMTFEYRHLTKYGIPRFPAFIGFRHPDDLV